MYRTVLLNAALVLVLGGATIWPNLALAETQKAKGRCGQLIEWLGQLRPKIKPSKPIVEQLPVVDAKQELEKHKLALKAFQANQEFKSEGEFWEGLIKKYQEVSENFEGAAEDVKLDLSSFYTKDERASKYIDILTNPDETILPHGLGSDPSLLSIFARYYALLTRQAWFKIESDLFEIQSFEIQNLIASNNITILQVKLFALKGSTKAQQETRDKLNNQVSKEQENQAAALGRAWMVRKNLVLNLERIYQIQRVVKKMSKVASYFPQYWKSLRFQIPDPSRVTYSSERERLQKQITQTNTAWSLLNATQKKEVLITQTQDRIHSQQRELEKTKRLSSEELQKEGLDAQKLATANLTLEISAACLEREKLALQREETILRQFTTERWFSTGYFKKRFDAIDAKSMLVTQKLRNLILRMGSRIAPQTLEPLKLDPLVALEPAELSSTNSSPLLGSDPQE